jgi:CRISPR-associated protein Cmr5
MAKTIQGIEQGRADFAYQCAVDGKNIATLRQLSEYDNQWFKDDKYKSYVKSLPMMIKTNGLGATIAFVFSKKAKEKEIERVKYQPGTQRNPKNAYDLIYAHINHWLHTEGNIYLLDDKAHLELSLSIIELNSGQYRAVTNEVLALFNWLRRFAEGLIDGEDENQD